ncbi:cation:proton antiporter regulatory subunit [Dactylosporangium fulvum]|uniref:Potassium transporter TrkA n=1 Tax=Dactylosporangium fulvum TaxID=53359 RepID=A0ABY5VR86_9ACTN|nr:TrkA C-terminal domain-containing protein [Dactylosporangium fulvum]UWP79003.1 potassium transporter TrkA [Dactylosporangium fulvum]
MRLERTPLPGIGIHHTAVTATQQQLGVVCHNTGRRDVVLYHPDDPQRVDHTVVLDPHEARQLAELLAATVMIDHIGAPEPSRDGVSAAYIRIPAGSPYAGRPLRDVRTDAPVVAVVRQRNVAVAPGPGFVLRAADAVIAVGERAVVAILAERLAGDCHRADEPEATVTQPS